MHKLVRPALEQLGIEPFIEQNSGVMETLRGKMKRIYVRVKERDGEITLFINKCLPLTAALIHVGTSKGSFGRAVNWAKQRRPHAPPVTLLATLLFLHLLDQTARLCPAENPDREMWEEARNQVQEYVVSTPQKLFL
jgi:hypothetical protein